MNEGNFYELLKYLRLEEIKKENDVDIPTDFYKDIIGFKEEELKKIMEKIKHLNVIMDKKVYKVMVDELKKSKETRLERMGVLCGKAESYEVNGITLQDNYYINKVITQDELEELMGKKVESYKNTISIVVANEYYEKHSDEVIARYHTHVTNNCLPSNLDIISSKMRFGKINLLFVLTTWNDETRLIPYTPWMLENKELDYYLKKVSIIIKNNKKYIIMN